MERKDQYSVRLRGFLNQLHDSAATHADIARQTHRPGVALTHTWYRDAIQRFLKQNPIPKGK